MSKISSMELTPDEVRAGILLALEAGGGKVRTMLLPVQVSRATGTEYPQYGKYEIDKWAGKVLGHARRMTDKGLIFRLAEGGSTAYVTPERKRAEEKAAQDRKAIADAVNERWTGITRRLRMQGFELTMQKGLSAADWEALLNRLEAGQRTEAGLQWANAWMDGEA